MDKEILTGKNCFITGASGGIGSKIAIQLAKNKSNVFLTGRDATKLCSIKKEIEDIGNNAKVFCDICDFNKTQDIKDIINAVRDKLGKIDVLVNCAGVFPVKSLADSTIEDFNECFNVNVRAPFIFCKEFSKDMVENKWGRIVNIGSSSAYVGFNDNSIYCASKHALLGFSRAFHNELKKHKVRIFCVSPSAVKTRMGKLIKNLDFNTFIEPEEIAKFIVFSISFNNNMNLEEVRLNTYL